MAAEYKDNEDNINMNIVRRGTTIIFGKNKGTSERKINGFKKVETKVLKIKRIIKGYSCTCQEHFTCRKLLQSEITCRPK